LYILPYVNEYILKKQDLVLTYYLLIL